LRDCFRRIPAYSHLDYKNEIKYIFKMIFRLSLCVFVLLAEVSFASSAWNDSAFVLQGALKESAEQVTRYSMSCDYARADAAARAMRAQDAGLSCIFVNIVRISRFDDLGDTAALNKAAASLSECRSSGVWDALREFELGYAQSALGRSVKGAMHTRSAAKIFEESADPDARAFYAIYAYYMSDALGFLPFFPDDKQTSLSVLEKASANSSLFWPLFVTPLVWMHYDRSEYKAALRLTDGALAKAPGHPVFLQMRADMLYRLKRYPEAAAIYEASAAGYLKRTGKSIRYYCAAGNLARIYNDAGAAAARDRWLAVLKTPEFKAMKAWMPASLMNDLKRKKLL